MDIEEYARKTYHYGGEINPTLELKALPTINITTELKIYQ